MSRAILWALVLATLTLGNAEGCAPGTFVNGTDCVPCPVGTFQPKDVTKEDPKVCQSCPPGYYCSRSGLSAPDGHCSQMSYQGFYCPEGSTRDRSLLCPANFYCEKASSAPSPCPEGKKSIPGANSISFCLGAHYEVCPPGQYRNNSRCSDCPSGTFQPSMIHGGSVNCQPCPVGQYCAAPAQAAPNGPCVFDGYYCPMRSTSPTGNLCPKRFYCPANNTTPIRCPNGTTSNPGAKAISECVEESITCPAGMYKNGSECTPCPVGTYQPSPTSVEGVSICKLCDPGSYCALPSAASVTGPCQAGYCCLGGCTMPTQQLCPKDHYCPNGTATPLKCPFQTTSGKGESSMSRCRSIFEDMNCHPGTYTNSTNGCEDCPVGTYQPRWTYGKGSYICVSCDEGNYCEHPGLAAPSGPCALGFHCPIGSTKPTQQLCPIGYYCPAGADIPGRCPSGTTSIAGSKAAANCTVIDTVECVSGYYRSGMNCVPCPEGTYKDHAGKGYEACSPCPVGSYCSGLNNTGYKQCPAGYYCPAGSNSSTDYLCPEDHYCEAGSDTPRKCSGLAYAGSTSKSNCSEHIPPVSPKGKYSVDRYSVDCPAGYYKPVSDRAGVDSCLVCPAGSYCPPGSVNPAGKCEAGYFCPRGSRWHITIICPADHYCPKGSGKATPCPAGKRSPPGSSSC